MVHTYFVYILAQRCTRALRGRHKNLERRLGEHRSGYDPEGYSSRHSTTRLVYFEMTRDVSSAIRREKRLKRLSRVRKLRLIEKVNPEWRDLAGE